MIAAREQITGGILGLVILLSSYLILATINPQLTILRLPGLEKITLPEIELPEPGEKKLPTYFQIPLGMIIEKTVLNEGILYGINQHNNSLILFDRFSLENYNEVFFGVAGSGKSYLVKIEILRSLMTGVDVI
ncbi:unnamed protein product, partial [marine sediment metagenome]